LFVLTIPESSFDILVILDVQFNELACLQEKWTVFWPWRCTLELLKRKVFSFGLDTDLLNSSNSGKDTYSLSFITSVRLIDKILMSARMTEMN